MISPSVASERKSLQPLLSAEFCLEAAGNNDEHPRGIEWKKARSEINRGFRYSKRKDRRSLGEREHPLVIPNQRSVHRNDEDYRRDVYDNDDDDDVGGSDDVNDKAATMPGRKTTREDRGHPRDIAQSGARCVFVVQARLYKCKGGQANT